MKLAEWINDERLTQSAAAKRLRIDQGFLSRLLSGKKHLSPEMAVRIERLTKGKVSFLELTHPRFRKASNG